MQIGYARISTQEQSLDLQKDALEQAGCERIFEDIAGGAKTDRPGLKDALAFCRASDVLVVWKLDRLGRSLKHLIETVNDLHGKGIGFKSIQESIDTTTPGGKLIFHVFGAIAEFERDLIRERTNAGLKAARARGRVGGRKPALSEPQRNSLITLYKSEEYTYEQIAEMLNCSKSTVCREVQRYKKTLAQEEAA